MLSTSKRVRFQRAAYRRRLQYLIGEAYAWRDTFDEQVFSTPNLERRWLAEERHASMDALIADLERAMLHVVLMP